MTKHSPVTVTLKEIVNAMPHNFDGDFTDLIGYVGKDPAAYLAKNGHEKYLVTWPDHVIIPKFNSDASYQRTYLR